MRLMAREGMMDIVLKLRELRRMSGLNQKEVAARSGVGEKSISSFETGDRVDSLKFSQLKRLLRVYGVSEEEFFTASFDRRTSSWERSEGEMAATLMDRLESLPAVIRRSLLTKFDLMADTASEVQRVAQPQRRSVHPSAAEWEMLTSRN
jgi:transcriptional regulator with XRE-family HTH domain